MQINYLNYTILQLIFLYNVIDWYKIICFFNYKSIIFFIIERKFDRNYIFLLYSGILLMGKQNILEYKIILTYFTVIIMNKLLLKNKKNNIQYNCKYIQSFYNFDEGIMILDSKGYILWHNKKEFICTLLEKESRENNNIMKLIILKDQKRLLKKIKYYFQNDLRQRLQGTIKLPQEIFIRYIIKPYSDHIISNGYILCISDITIEMQTLFQIKMNISDLNDIKQKQLKRLDDQCSEKVCYLHNEIIDMLDSNLNELIRLEDECLKLCKENNDCYLCKVEETQAFCRSSLDEIRRIIKDNKRGEMI